MHSSFQIRLQGMQQRENARRTKSEYDCVSRTTCIYFDYTYKHTVVKLAVIGLAEKLEEAVKLLMKKMH